MTSNQIAYWRLKEEQRSNLAQEHENKRANLAKEQENNRSNVARETETHRSNLINEQHQRDVLAETVRSHQVSEAETNRANLAREQVNWFNAIEQQRSNVAREAETHRTNVANENIQYERNSINREHYERMDEETNRHNLAYEGLQAEQNDINRQNIQLGYDTLAQRERESQRSYEATKYSADSRYSASVYAANTSASVGWGNLAELNRHNQQMEYTNLLGVSANYRVQTQQNQYRADQLSNDMAKWTGEQNVRDSQANLNNQRAVSESELRDAKKANLYSSTGQNWTKAFANVFSVLPSTKGGKK